MKDCHLLEHPRFRTISRKQANNLSLCLFFMLRVLPFLRGYTQSLVQSLVSLEAMFILKVGPPLLNIPRSTHGVEWLGITPPPLRSITLCCQRSMPWRRINIEHMVMRRKPVRYSPSLYESTYANLLLIPPGYFLLWSSITLPG